MSMSFNLTPPRVVNITRVRGKRKKHDIYIGRYVFTEGEVFPRSKWCNPFPRWQHDTGEALNLYEEYIRKSQDLMSSIPELTGKVLGCWCKPKRCHGDILVKIWKEVTGFIERKEKERTVELL